MNIEHFMHFHHILSHRRLIKKKRVIHVNEKNILHHQYLIVLQWKNKLSINLVINY